jgi:hypothetical protein
MKTILLTSLLAFGCSAKNDRTADSQTNDETFTVWSGWNHTWTMLSHRISLIRVKAGDINSAESGILGGDWSTGESWSDDVDYRIHQQIVTSSTIQAEQGETVLTVGPDGSASATSTTTLSDARLVVLRGFEINTDVAQSDSYPEDYDPALGYTSAGFGINATLSGDQVTVTASVDWGPRDRADVNAAIPHADTGVTVYWTALSGIESVTTSRFEGGQELAHTPPNSPQEGLVEALDWSGTGIAALSGFELAISDVDGGDGGDYLRSFGAEIPPTETGEAPSEIAAEILNTSFIELAHMRMDFEVDAFWIPTTAGDTTIVGQSLTGNHAIGTHTVLAP